ncbi:MAG: tetratricopeptide repeat protein [Phycisphaerales bacterium]|nr:tetratricopeptide repeat protein [Phycisphaerales bacterium]NNM26577.1 tetratricopeptide repeat protein [Phycisphaerales bacterium]
MPRSRRNLLAYLALLTLVVTAAAGLGRHLARPVMTPVRPGAGERLERQTRALIDEAIADVERHPRNAAARGTLGLVYEANDLWHAALATYRQAAVLDPSDVAWRYRMAVTLHGVARTGEAIRHLTRLTETHPTHAPAWHRLGAWRLEQGDLGGAKRAFEAAATHAPERGAGLSGVGQVQLRRGRYAEAAATLERALALEPDAQRTHYLLGRAYAGAGRDAEAAPHLALGAGAAMQPLPDRNDERLLELIANAPAQVRRARWWLEREQPTDALPLLAAAVSERAEDTTLRCEYARACVRAGALDQAETMITALLLSAPDESCSHLALAECRIAQERWDEALTAANQAITHAPRHAGARLARGRALHALGQSPLAGTTLLTARVIDPDDPEIALALGQTLLDIGQADVARTHLTALAEVGPGRVDLLTRGAAALLDAGDPATATRLLDVATLTAPGDERITRLRARLEAPE